MLTQLINKLNARFTSDLKQIDWQRTILLILLILAIFSAGWQHIMPQVRTITETRFQRVPEIRRVRDVERVYVACPEKGIVTLDKDAVAKKLKIDWLQGGDIAAAKAADKNPLVVQGVISPSPEGTTPSLVKGRDGEGLEVTATADLPESDNGYEGVSVIDTASGESQIMAREKASPWFQFRNDGAIGIKYGFNQHLISTGTAYGRWDFLRVKNIYFSVNADLSTDGSAKLQFGAEHRW